MFGRRFHLFDLFGFPVRADMSWFVVAVLLAWSYATLFLPPQYPDLAVSTLWAMAITLTLGLFASVILHEVAHALAARHYQLPIKGITLFIFGGVAEMSDEPPHPRAEFVVAVAGPLASLAIGAAMGAAWLLGSGAGLAPPARAVAGYLSAMNFLLALFNMIPAFPLDGGRVLRSILWDWQKSLTRATRITSAIGSAFGIALIVLGGILFLEQAFVAGVWMVLIGFFLRNAARMSYRQVLLRRVLEGEPVSRFMHLHPVAVPRAISVQDLVQEFVLRHHHKMYPVVDGDRLVGCVTTLRIKGLPREEWPRQTVGSITESCDPDNTVSPETDAMTALAKMSHNRSARLIVAEGDRLVGILSLKDLLKFFSLKTELESGR